MGSKTLLCQQCQKTRKAHLFKTETPPLCIFCDMENFGNSSVWIPCPACGKEVNRLREPGKCYDCVEADIETNLRIAAQDARIVALFGSHEAVKFFTFNNWDPIPKLDKVYAKCFNFNPANQNLYLWGPPGRGKTHLAYAIAIKQLKAGRSVEVLAVRELVGKFRRKNYEDEVAEMEKLRKVDVLIIDDLGQGRDTDFAISVVTDILNKRSLNCKNGLVITSNLFLDDLAAKYHEDRIVSRLGGVCDIIELVSTVDYRLERKFGK